MATVGQALTSPDLGYTRYDDPNSNFTYTGSSWSTNLLGGVGLYNNTSHFSSVAGEKIQFNFTKSKLRLISQLYSNRTTSADVFIDGNKAFTFSGYLAGDTGVTQCLVMDLTNLSLGEHCVTIVNNATGGYGGILNFDAIDIDSAGALKPYNPNIPHQQSQVIGAVM